jgi:acyl carrier protein
VVAIEKRLGIKLQPHEVGREAFASAAALHGYVTRQLAEQQAAGSAS